MVQKGVERGVVFPFVRPFVDRLRYFSLLEEYLASLSKVCTVKHVLFMYYLILSAG